MAHTKEFLKYTVSDLDILQEVIEEHKLNSPRPSISLNVSPICTFRRALDSDIPEIETLITSTTYDVFGHCETHIKIKKCYYSMVAINADDRIIAAICLDDYPNIPALPKSEWETWIKNLYNLQNLTSQNTLWIHLIACHCVYTHTFLKPLLENVYLNFPYLIHLVVVLPGETPCFCFLEENFTCVMPVGYTNQKKVQTLYLTLRHHYIKKYKIRLAVEEDNDDIVSIIDTHSPKLKQLYGDFYVSEILTKFPGMNRKLIVAEIAERAVAVLFLNDAVNYNSLIGSFNLEPFANLHALAQDGIVRRSSVNQSFSDEDIASDIVSVKASTPSISKISAHSENDDYCLDDVITISEIFDLEKLGLMTNDGGLADSDYEYADLLTKTSSTPSEKCTLELNNTTLFSHPSTSLIQFSLPYQSKSAFSLEIMASGEEHEQGVLCDLLEAAFQGFVKKDKDFCVFSVLHKQTHFPLFDFFVRAIPRNTATFPHEVYILHKNSIKANLEVRKMSKGEYSKVKTLISNIFNVAILIDAITRSLYGGNRDVKTYVMANSNVIVGLMLIKIETYSDIYFERFQCYKYVDSSVHRYDRCGLVEFCIISAIFQKHMQFFLKEVHRMADISILFYKMPQLELFQKTRTKPLPGILKDMLPVLNRHQPNFSNILLDHVEVPTCMKQPMEEDFALFISTTRLCSLPRIEVNSRIVIVGASCTSLSFLESLIFHYDGTRHVNFNNLNLIYDRTIMDSSNIYKYIPYMFLYRGKYTGRKINSIYFNAHANYIHGFMTGINRKFKYITLNNTSIVPYDYLFLMCGIQYHQPYGIGIRKDKMTEPCPQNVFLINKYCDAEHAFSMVNSLIKKKRKVVIIVYGSCFNTYGCITALEKGRAGNQIIKFVEPVPDEFERPSIDPFNNPDIYEAFHDILYLIGIEVYTGYYFYEWEVEKNLVTNVKYQSRKGAISFHCDFIFHFANKEVNYDTFCAVNNAGLVYDGKLVINSDCRTNDPYIFAAGPMTKYSRRHFADRFLHKYYNSHEIGERLGRQIRSMCLPGGLKGNGGDEIFDILNSAETNKLVPKYIDPVLVSFVLPGGINYLDIHGPGKPVPLETQKNIIHIFETGNLKRIELDEDPEYFRLQINSYMKVDQIVCFTRKEIDVTNLQRLWGLHEQSLNNLVARYQKGMITNFYDYFRNPYFCVFYTDRFSDLHDRLQMILTLLTSERGKSIIEDIVGKLIRNNWKRLHPIQEARIKSKFIRSPYQQLMVEEIMSFLEVHSDYLPMYAHPLITKIILYDVEASPIFVKLPSYSRSMSSD